MAGRGAKLEVVVAGDTRHLDKALAQASARLQKFGDDTDDLSAGFGRSRIAGIRLRSSLAPLAGGLVVAGQASRQLSASLRVTGAEAATTEGRLRNAGSSILSGDFVGAIKALRTQPELSAGALDEMAAASLKAGNQTEVDAAKAATASLGWKKLSDQLNEVSAAASQVTANLAVAGVEAQLSSVAARTGLSGALADAAQFGERTDRFGRGPGASAEQNSRAGNAAAGKNTLKALAIPAGLRGRELDARLSGSRVALKGALAQEAQFLQSSLKALTGERANEVKSALVGVTNEIRSIDEAIIADADEKQRALKAAREAQEAARAKAIAALKAQAAAFADQADAIKSAVLDRFDTKTAKVDNSRALADAKESLRVARMVGAPSGIKEAQRQLDDANLAIKRQAIVDTPFRVSDGPKGPVNALTVGTQNFYITGNDPEAIAKKVAAIIVKGSKRTAGQSRGRTSGNPLLF